MTNMLSIFFIGFALSMDAFFLAVGIGTTQINTRTKLKMTILIGLFHFVLPILGLNFGEIILKIISINIHILVTIIFLYIGLTMQFGNKIKKKPLKYNLFNIVILALSVSMDSFAVGIGMPIYTTNTILPSLIFAVCSGSLAYIGFILGANSITYLNDKAPKFGAITLYTLAIVNIVEHFL